MVDLTGDNEHRRHENKILKQCIATLWQISCEGEKRQRGHFIVASLSAVLHVKKEDYIASVRATRNLR